MTDDEFVQLQLAAWCAAETDAAARARKKSCEVTAADARGAPHHGNNSENKDENEIEENAKNEAGNEKFSWSNTSGRWQKVYDPERGLEVMEDRETQMKNREHPGAAAPPP